MRALATQGPARSGRTFAYSNLGYELAGIVLDPAHEGGWKRVVEREVLVPLGMHRTTAYRSALPNARLAMPHRTTTDGLERIALAKQDSNMGPAGGLFSTAGDLARLVVAELNGGRLDGRECVPSGVIAATQRARVPQQRVVLGYRRFAWGLGWDLGTCDGDTVVHRFGEFPGFASRVSFMPARGVGVVVLSNGGQGGSMLADAVAAALYDRLLERPDARAREVARLDTLTAGVQELRVALAADRERRAARSQTLAHPLAAYAGTYASPEWGTLRLRVRGSHLEAAMGVARSAVEVYDAATEKLRVELFGGGSVIEAVFAPGESRARAMRIMGATLARR
jgi:CubicO group peptidase (beta-lactamase class C family)